MSSSFRNPAALLLYASLALAGALALLLTGHPVPGWLQGLCTAGLVGGAGVMTPGLLTVERLLGAQFANSPVLAAPDGQAGKTGPPATVGLTPADVEATA